MVLFEWIILLLLFAVLTAAVARRVKVPYPAFLALGGAALAFVPHVPNIALDPDLALALFLAPILLDAAYDTSLRDLKRNWLPVTSLVVMAVSVTTLAVAVVVRLLVPGMPWAVAFVLGAAVSPPDAAAATAVLRQVRLPHRLLVILEGESLLNDASALLIYRAAVAATLANAFHPVHDAAPLLLAIVGSVVLGIICAVLFMRFTRMFCDIPSSIVLQFVGTFGVWILADHWSLSPVLSVVTYGITIARRAPIVIPARMRVPSYAVWETVVFILNVLAFLLIGLQLGPIWARLTRNEHARFVGVAIAVLITCIAARFAWVMTYMLIVRWRLRRHSARVKPPADNASPGPTLRGALVISWCGMRGMVSLAAALALPARVGGTAGFPHHDLIVLCAFAVVLGTLVLQGFTLSPLLAWLDLRDDGPVQREVNLARSTALRAAIDALSNDDSPLAQSMRREYEDALRGADGRDDGAMPGQLAGDPLRRRSVAAARQALADLRSSNEIGDAAFHRLEEELDWLELSAGGREGA